MEDNNDHNGCAKLLVDSFGTSEEQDAITVIANDYSKRGFMEEHELIKRYEITKKYFRLLYEISK